MLKRKLDETTTEVPTKKRKLNNDINKNNDEINEEDEYENEEKVLDKQKKQKIMDNNENENNEPNIDNEMDKKTTKNIDNNNVDNNQEFTLKANSFVYNETSMNAFDGFDGQGFGALTESGDTIDNNNDNNNDAKTDNTNNNNNNDKSEENGTNNNEFNFQFKFDSWGNDNDNGGITFNFEDFDPKKYGSESVEYTDQNNFDTDKPVAVLNGEELDSGDKNDDNLYKVNCTIYKLITDDDDNTRYQEKGKGILNVNTYSDDNKKTKGRLLCRRDKILSTILNIGITKKIKFNIVNDSFIRFSILELIDDNNNNNNEDIDLKGSQQLTTYLIKPKVKTECPSLLEHIQKVQDLI